MINDLALLGPMGVCLVALYNRRRPHLSLTADRAYFKPLPIRMHPNPADAPLIDAENLSDKRDHLMIKYLSLALIALSIADHSSRADQYLTTPSRTAGLSKPDADGFITLFNGHDLAGWTGLAEYWSVRDGSISGHETRDTSRQTFLVFSAFKVTDFELHLKYRFVSPEGNSGIQFRSMVLDSKTYSVGGYQADFDAEAGFDGSIYDEAGVAGNRGTISNRGEKTTWDAEYKRHIEPLGESGPDLKKLIKPGEWNDVVLVANGNHVVYSINGRVMTDLVDDTPAALREGVLALQLHAGFTMDVRFKDVRIKVPRE
jgi:hypothetical protein